MLITWYLTSVLAMLITWYRHRYLPCYIWYMISTLLLAMLYLLFDIWYQYLPCYTHRLISDTWYNNTWHLTCYHSVLVHLTWYCAPILYYIFMTITFTGTWHDYYPVTRYLVLLNSCTLELLYSWTPEKGWLLILYSWYYTHVNSRSWIIMVILYTLVDIIFGQCIYIIKYSTYTGVGETDGNCYDVIFIMVIFLKCRVGRVMISPRK